MSDIQQTQVSDAEMMVLLAMRSDPRVGRAIYRYAMSFDDYENIDPTAPPYTSRP